MNKTFKKIAASVMAVTSLVVSMTSFSASAVEPRYGGSDSFTINGARVTTSIDAYKTVVGASTSTSSNAHVTVSLTGTNSNGSSVNKYGAADYDAETEKSKISVSVYPSSGSTFTKGSSYHTAKYSGATGSKSMSATVPV